MEVFGWMLWTIGLIGTVISMIRAIKSRLRKDSIIALIIGWVFHLVMWIAYVVIFMK